jgi:predicted 2-oxoglutarate/Fe(II)-dependent dioxygenase YbiX
MRYDWWHWDSVLTKKEIRELNHRLDKVSFKDRDVYGQEAKKTSDVKFVYYGDIKDKIKNLIDKALMTNRDSFGYNLFPPNDLETLLYNTYSEDKKGEYEYHHDTNFCDYNDTKLTLLINISQKEYKGGDFYIFSPHKNKPIKEFSKPGDMILFKSYHFHKVKPVVKGERKSLSYFFIGPKFS